MTVLKAAIVSLVALALGCASFSEYTKMKNFENTVRAYSDAMHWSDFQVAQGFIKIGSSEMEDPDLEDLKRVRVVNYDIRQSYPSGDKQTVRRVVGITYYRIDENVVKRLTEEEVWEYDEPSKRWLLSSGLPQFE